MTTRRDARQPVELSDPRHGPSDTTPDIDGRGNLREGSDPRSGAATEENLLSRLGIDADESGALFGVTGRGWRKWDAAGLVPAPFYLGRLPRWSPGELRAWSAAGAPSRERWEAMRGGRP